MSIHTCTVRWQGGGSGFVEQRYSRAHEWRFDGGAVVPGSSSPHSVPLPWSDPAAVDPEEAFVAAVASCHMLWFLALAARDGFCVTRYEDAAQGTLGTMPSGRQGMTQVRLQPLVQFAGENPPDADTLARLHHEAHERCYIANSVLTEITVAP